jgi:hypothetical protein
MDIDDVANLFSDRPFKMTHIHRSLLTRMIAVCRCAKDWSEDPKDPEFIDALIESIEELSDYED